MTPDEYLAAVLDSQKLKDDSDEMKKLRQHRDDVETLLRQAFSDCTPTIRYGGSKAKGTMVKNAYDLDVICYFDRADDGCGDTLREIYFNVRDALKNDYLVEEKPSAIRLRSLSPDNYNADFHIDVVPGRFVEEGSDDVFLYRSSGEKERQKTNLEVHLSHVRESGVREAIKLFKLWRARNGLSVRHFILELLVIDLLSGKSGKPLSEQLTHVWTELRDNVHDMSVEDPANPNGNDLSELFNASVKQDLSSVASTTLHLIEINDWTSTFGPVSNAETDDRVDALKRAAGAVTTPSKPWHSI
jgi:hypothetical protein